jgi:hypothetical protein
MKINDELNSVSPHSCQYYVGSSAVLSECGNYRYELSRIWDTTKPMVMFLMLNPSTADANKDDNTIRRCIAYAKSWGYGGVFVGNLFAYRATNPKELLNVKNPVGEKNQSHLIKMSLKTDMTICAWGNSSIVEKLTKSLGYFKPLSGLQNRFNYLELSKNGTPKHPLYLKCNLLPIKYEIPSRSLS